MGFGEQLNYESKIALRSFISLLFINSCQFRLLGCSLYLALLPKFSFCLVEKHLYQLNQVKKIRTIFNDAPM